MFATLAADYPREPRPGEPDVLGDADRRLAAGEMTATEHGEVVRKAIKQVLEEQEASGLGMLTDGGLANEDRLRALVEGLGGTSSDRLVVLPDGATVHAPRFDKAPAWQAPITVDAWVWADRATDIPLKPVLIGPYTIARLAERWPWQRPSTSSSSRWPRRGARSSRSTRARSRPSATTRPSGASTPRRSGD